MLLRLKDKLAAKFPHLRSLLERLLMLKVQMPAPLAVTATKKTIADAPQGVVPDN